MKKSVLIAAVSTLGLLLAACGPSNSSKSSDTSATKTKSLTVWADKDKSDGIKSAVKQFEKDNNVKVKIVEKAYADQLESLRLDGPAGSGPDIITIPSDQIGTATTEGLLKPLTVSKATQKQYTDSAMQSQIVKGKVYGLPRTIETTFLYYNKKFLSEKDLPKTTDEWLTYSKQQVAAGKYGLLALWDQVYYAGGILSSYGGYIFNKDAKGNYDTSDIGLNNAGAVKAATYIKSFYDAGVFPKGILGDQGINTLDSLFTEGKAAAVISGPWNIQPYKKAGIDYGVAVLPTLPNGKHMRSYIGVKSWNVSSYSKNGAMAEKLVKYLSNKQNLLTAFKKTQEVPAVKSLVNSTAVKNSIGAETVAKQSQYAELTPSISAMDQVWDPANNALQVINTGKQAPKTALDNAVKTIKSAIKANKK
jgi:arabinogalactan oligomer/maltooligosaccharide transport system substrate-binding protein